MNSIEKLLNGAPNYKILVAGDLMLDVYDFCSSEHSRPSPERPDKQVYTTHHSKKILGGAANVAANLAALRVETSILSICGDDGNALEARRLCRASGIRHCLIQDSSRPTSIKTRIYIDDHYLLRRDDELTHKASTKLSSEISVEFERMLDSVDAVILSDYNKGFFTKKNVQIMISLCRDRAIPVIVDLKPPNAFLFSNATVIAPNLKEAREIFSGFDPYQKENSLRTICALLGAEQIIVTLGAEGILVYENGNATHIPGRTVRAVDPCGCGDTVRACLTLGLISGLNLVKAAEFANNAASLAIQKLGTATLSPDELKKKNQK